ncbi:Ig-like domain repeat protein [Streptomyces sp. RY43-2]|uniref:Ig-like domain repeat protein n=1 Tax=Streptomyces macrolidinus TaxID=2952607 RepID=A0ABT0ZJ45_9ACTN|nr:Ig-like domain repeat protein [Streptomyces macrolidinus]MCN9243593.1 Ig-like domain repeat protein [Streptomyces macrolidinus]
MVATLVAALCLTGLAASPASAQQSPPTDIALAWGLNDLGQLGDGTTTNRNTPVAVDLPAGTQLTAVAGGGEHSLGLTSDGRVLAWGGNFFGQLGDGTLTDRLTPVTVDLPAGTQVTAIAAGLNFSLALTSDGHVLAWGENVNGQLGDGTTTNRLTPVEVHLPAGTQITAIAAGERHSLAVTSDGRVFAWGRNDLGQLGDGTTIFRTTPVETLLPAGVQATAVAGGEGHSLAVTSDGRVFAWGWNAFGQLGDGTTINRLTPVEVHLPVGTHAVAVAAGNDSRHSLALTSDGGVLAWGLNSSGQLGDGTTTNRLTPVEALLPVGTQVTAISAGNVHSLALASDGRVLAWGGNTFGQLGDGTNITRLTPVETLIPADVHATAISAGGLHSLASAVRGTSTTTLTVSPTTVAPGQPVTLTAHVTCTTGTPTGGEVVFFDGTTQIGTATVDAQGNATFTTSSLSLGTHEITARFQGMGDCPASVSAPVTVTVEEVQASLTLDKRVVSEGPFKVGDRVEYAYTVTNTGNTVLTNVRVTDDLVAQVTCDVTRLAPGQSTTCHGSHTITRADVTPCKTAKERGGDKGHGKHQVMRCQVTNTAHATAIDPNGDEVTSDEATATITVKVEKKKEKEEKEHCRKHHGSHKVYGNDRCDDGHHRRAAQQA